MEEILEIAVYGGINNSELEDAILHNILNFGVDAKYDYITLREDNGEKSSSDDEFIESALIERIKTETEELNQKESDSRLEESSYSYIKWETRTFEFSDRNIDKELYNNNVMETGAIRNKTNYVNQIATKELLIPEAGKQTVLHPEHSYKTLPEQHLKSHEIHDKGDLMLKCSKCSYKILKPADFKSHQIKQNIQWLHCPKCYFKIIINLDNSSENRSSYSPFSFTSSAIINLSTPGNHSGEEVAVLKNPNLEKPFCQNLVSQCLPDDLGKKPPIIQNLVLKSKINHYRKPNLSFIINKKLNFKKHRKQAAKIKSLGFALEMLFNSSEITEENGTKWEYVKKCLDKLGDNYK